MSEWKESKLKEVVDIRVSNVDKKIYPNKSLVKLCNYMDVYKNDYISSKISFINGSADKNEILRFGLQINDVIITKDSETPDDIAVSSVVSEKIENLVCGYHLAILRPNQDEVDGRFLMFMFKLPAIKNYFFSVANGSTRYGLTIGNIENAKLRFPPLPTQRRIARILSTADAVIEKTQAAIAKYKAIKQGMLQDLFTRGIDTQTSKLRPKYQDAPELYKESKLGWIPKEWEVEIFGEQVELVHGHQFRNYDFTEFGFPIVKIGQVKPENLNLSDCSCVSFDRIDEFINEIIGNGDVLMALTGATLGKACLVHGLNGIVLQNYRVGRFEPKIREKDIDKTFLYYILIAGELLNQIFSKVNSGAQGNIGKADFEKATFKKPKFNEQLLIAQRLQSIDNKIQTEQTYLHKLQQIKAGLMADLLNGKKEVIITDQEILTERNN
ncbi:MAG: restriction endonuclease subunit S [Candidatus Marinimicrobia bacterium]|nr:restriction endonuclease subunit S [Candidatus Neomarinimicrobiota bacterium]